MNKRKVGKMTLMLTKPLVLSHLEIKSEVDSVNASGTQALTLRGLSNPGVVALGNKKANIPQGQTQGPTAAALFPSSGGIVAAVCLRTMTFLQAVSVCGCALKKKVLLFPHSFSTDATKDTLHSHSFQPQ